MPSFRDLKGRPVDEVVDSREIPGLPDAGQQLAEREAVRQAVEKMQGRKPEREVLTFPDPSGGPDPDPPRAVEIPADMAAALDALAETSTALHIAVTDGVKLIHEQVRAIRARAEKDAAKLARLNDLLKTLDD